MEIIILEVLLSLAGSVVGAVIGIKDKSNCQKIDNVISKKCIKDRHSRIIKTDNKDLRYINTSNIEFISHDYSFVSFLDYYKIDTNIIFDFTDPNNIKEFMLDIPINKYSGIYFKDNKTKILPSMVFKNDISSLIKINNLEELNLLLKDIDKKMYSTYIGAYFEQIKISYNKIDEKIIEYKNYIIKK